MTRVRDVEITTPNGPLPAFFARSFDFPNPTVIVLHEWFGLDGHIQDVALRFTSSHEYSSIAPDLYRGRLAEDAEEAEKLMTGLDRDAAFADLQATIAWLQRQGVEKIAVVGLSLGGDLAFDLAHRDDRLSAAVLFYGLGDHGGRTPLAPIQVHIGSEDAWYGEGIEAARAHLEAHGGEVHVYEGAQHDFFREADEAFDEEAAELAWDRTVEFISKRFQD